MSIFSSIGKAIKSAATYTYNTVNSVASGVKKAFSQGGTQTSNANSSLQGSYIPGSYTGAGQNTAKDLKTGGYSAGGSTGTWTTTPTAQPTKISSGGSNMVNNALNMNGGSSSSNFSPSLSSFVQTPQAPTTLTASVLNSGGTGLSRTSSGGAGTSVGTVPSLVLPTNSVGNNPGKVDNTKLAGTLAQYKKLNPQTGLYEDMTSVDGQKTDEQLAQDRANIYDKYLGKKENVLQSREVRQQQEQVRQRQQEVNNATSELNAVVAKQNQDLLQLRETGSKEGVTEAVYGGQQVTINREAAYRALPLQASISAAQGNLALAQDYLAQVTAMKTEEVNNEYNYKKGLLDSIIPSLDKADQRRYDELKTQNDRTYKESRDFIDVQSKLLQSAVSQKAPTAVINAINSATSTQQAIIAAGQYAGNVMEQKTNEVQYNNAILQGQKLKAEIESNQPITGEYSSVINGAAGLVPSTKKTQVKQNIASALASGNFVNAYAELANAVSDGITGTNKTKFDDARTDIGILGGMKDAIVSYSNAGGDMGLLKGTEEQIKRKLGVDSGKASALATQLWREFQTYRSNMTGAAFTPQESRDYASVNPTLGKSLDLNLNVIDGAINQLTNGVTSTVNARIPEAQKIYDLATGKQTSTSGVLKSPDGTSQVSISDLTEAQIQEAKSAGWK